MFNFAFCWFKDPSILECLQPIIQAAQLLQARKYDEDVNNVCEMCMKMSVPQVDHTLYMTSFRHPTLYPLENVIDLVVGQGI